MCRAQDDGVVLVDGGDDDDDDDDDDDGVEDDNTSSSLASALPVLCAGRAHSSPSIIAQRATLQLGNSHKPCLGVSYE